MISSTDIQREAANGPGVPSSQLRLGLRGELTPRDLDAAAWVGRLAGATRGDLQVRFGLGKSQVYRRVQVLVQFGMVESRRVLAERPALLTAPGKPLRPASYEHAVRVARQVAESEASGKLVISELELRRERAGKQALPGWVGEDDRIVALSCRRVPDLIERLPSGGLRAIEIELSSKGRSRRERVLGHYAASKYEEVKWLVPNGQLAAVIRREIDRLGLARYVEVVDDC